MSENQLSAAYGFSRQTVRQALGILEQEGVLVRRRGSGTYIAGGRSTQRTRTIGLIATYITDYIFPAIIRGTEETLSAAGYHLSLGVTQNRVETEAQLLHSFYRKRSGRADCGRHQDGAAQPRILSFTTNCRIWVCPACSLTAFIRNCPAVCMW